MRINLDPEAGRYGFSIPKPLIKLLDEICEEFRQEYKVGTNSTFCYLFDRSTFGERLIPLLRAKGLQAEAYDIPQLESWGFVVPNDDPVLVEYILRYGDEDAR